MRSRSFQLTQALVAAHCGGPVVLLDAGAIGREYRLHAERPGPELNERITGAGLAPRAATISPDGAVLETDPAAEAAPFVTRVDIRGPIEQRAGFYDLCGGWSDGHDAIAERLCAALEAGDVFLVLDTPGGAHAGLGEAVRRVLDVKTALGRHVTGFGDEMIGSAGFYWASCVCDEIYIPASGIAGSIGARASHESIAGHLEQEGVEVTYFAWPDEGKVALAPEHPLSDLGRARGNRDVMAAGEMFAAAVASSPFGLRHGLDRDAIVALHADALTGQAAVDAGLADGVSSIEDALGYALALAGSTTETETGSAETAPTGEATMTKAQIEAARKAGLRAAGTAGATSARAAKEEPEPAAGTEPDGACAKCGSANEGNAKFCDQCGASMAAESAPPPEKPEPEEEGDDPPPPSSKPAPPPPPDAAAGPPKPGAASPAASVASMLGLRDAASVPAIKSALLPLLSLRDAALRLTGTHTPDEARGALTALAEDAARSGQLKEELSSAHRHANARERLDILKGLAAAGVHTRGELLVDVLENGKIVGVRPAPLWGPGPEGRTLANLRGYAKSKLANGGPAPSRSPYEPDPAPLEAAATPSRVATPAAIEAAKRHPAVLAAASRPGAASLDQIAAAHVASFGSTSGAPHVLPPSTVQQGASS